LYIALDTIPGLKKLNDGLTTYQPPPPKIIEETSKAMAKEVEIFDIEELREPQDVDTSS